MLYRKSFALITAVAAVGLVTATAPADAQWRRGGYYYGHYRGIGPGAIVGGALLGLGVGALLAAPYATYAAPPPPVYYAPPPAYYPPPAYVYAPRPYSYYPPY